MAPQQLTEFNIHINETNINIIGAALGNLPYAQVSGLISDLRTQVQQQQTAFAQLQAQGQQPLAPVAPAPAAGAEAPAVADLIEADTAELQPVG